MRWLVVALVLAPSLAHARDWFVAPGGSGDGSAGAPFGSIQTAIGAAMPGDVIQVAAGTYMEALQTQRAGDAAATITIRGADGAIVTAAGRTITIRHPFHVIENVVFDGQYGDDDAVRIESPAESLILRDCEVRRATRDCIDMGAPANVLIEGCLIHHCLNAANGRTDAHGIVGGSVRDLTIRNTEIHTFSGDAMQFDPGRAAPGWDRVIVEGCKLWLAPLPAPENGFSAGAVPGENAIDTKVLATAPVAHLTVRDTIAYGFRAGLITNMAAFNLKERVVAELDGVTIYDSELALRLRAPADVTVKNAVIHDVLAAVRYEDNIVTPHIYSSTFGSGITNAFVEASSSATMIDGKNVLVLGALPPELSAMTGSLAVDATAFVDAAAHDYHLAAGSPAIDRGVEVPVTSDRDGNVRPHGAMHDVGAYEQCEPNCVAAPDAGSGGGNGDDEPGTPGGCCHAGEGEPPLPAFILVALFAIRRRRR
ncbi:MAG TPA: choice-of-anchor Q domain-containing protein [Kofleriaceae bacterium]